MTYKKPFTWSISALEAWESCPKKFFHVRVSKDVKEPPNAASTEGTESHMYFEKRLSKGVPLPMHLAHHDKFLQKLIDAPGEDFTEQRVGINRDFQGTGFFDDDIWCRAVIDYMKINGTKAVIVDHKFGKMKEGFDQLRLTCAMVAALRPEVETFTSMYYWAKAKKITNITLQKKEIMDVWNDFLPRVQRMEKAFKESDFPARESGLCKKWCHVTSCVHNGRY